MKVVFDLLCHKVFNTFYNIAFVKSERCWLRAVLDRFRSRTRTSKTTWKWRQNGVAYPYMGTTRHFHVVSFSYPEPFLRAVNGARRGALAKSISNWHLIGYNECYFSNTGYILLPCFYGIRFWIWPEPLVAPRVRRALGTRMTSSLTSASSI
jgi:hypothetical protein